MIKMHLSKNTRINMSDKNKAIITVGLSIVILAGIFLYNGITRYNTLMQQSIAQVDKRFRAHIKDLKKYSFSPYAARIDNIIRLESEMVAAFAKRNREILHSTTLPVYEALKRENPSFKVMHFHLPDGTTFLRMHNPGFFGDNLRNIRPIIEDVSKTKTPRSGFEIGRHGPYYRIVQPVFFEDNFIGVLEFGIKVHQLLEAAQSNLSDKSTTYFLETEWQKVNHETKHFTMKRFEEFVLNTHNDPFYLNLPSKINFRNHFNRIELDDRVYILHSQPVLRNYSQEVLGGIVVPQDITHLIQEKNRFVLQMTILVLLLTVLSLSILYISFNNLVRILEKSKEKLKDSVNALTTEVKEREKAEDRALEAQTEWEKTFNVMDTMITIQDRDMFIVRANKTAEDFFEVGRGGLNGKKCHEVFRGSSHPCSKCPGLDTLQDIQNHSEIIDHKELKKIFQVSSAPLFNKNNEIRHIVHVARDITKQKELEQELFQAHKMEAIGTLAGGIAHDFNNILSAIIGFTELAKTKTDKDSKIAVNLAEVLRASNRATELVKQILTISRKGSGQKRNALQPYPIVNEALKLIRASIPTTMDIQADIDPKCGFILADPTNVHQIVINLCTNALHATEEETGIIKISLLDREVGPDEIPEHLNISAGSFIELSVTDKGCGMDEKTQKRIFEPYFTTKKMGKGTGLGLSVVFGIVQDLEGVITVESTLGEGTTFHVLFPKIQDEKRPVQIEVKESLKKGTERILIVDDESLIVALQEAILSPFGYKITAKTSSEEILAVFKDNPNNFDLLITDQTMPGLSGVQLAREILRIRPDMPIIVCTGYSATLTEKSAMEIGIKKYLTKPVEQKELVRSVRNVLDQK